MKYIYMLLATLTVYSLSITAAQADYITRECTYQPYCGFIIPAPHICAAPITRVYCQEYQCNAAWGCMPTRWYWL